ncbi:50S ribosomal protein L15 [Alienimonas californiensis]|uniref:Large ribosomal subunit protein uL15 n=1 Tax=Alienimonas californiensis TaxID=2527989 RepID=A0A517P9J9_9PLAN|nr:50S ribosomal protein L15 [Alienimonas californiensis]
MIIDDVHKDIRKNRKKKRVGRGPGSGHGKTSGRGHKGFYSRAGSSRRTGFAGGTTPLFMRVAKRGFSNAKYRLKVAAVNVSSLEVFDGGTEITPEFLKEKGFTNGPFDVVKILGDGELTKKLTVKAHRFSASARQKIEAAGGTVVEVERTKAESKRSRGVSAAMAAAGETVSGAAGSAAHAAAGVVSRAAKAVSDAAESVKETLTGDDDSADADESVDK